ncbi:LysR family transcriptional regulator, hydrogen peroxide-inducible genes activator [Chitinophaga sp. YR627]|uniref:hydrogen peroxide-inducible genes activator n=1 Tax=Chitinophaga sp. YR627 TaxID=1881041 RepID=UPI0008F3263B|nr:hydrogen peroxide-inducible genes activator [Chitinophaga sp. YR627]SFN23687.1 LysR family transcriptional regulator, hydrogen peroxide-inducible genes activator [Chitinophaga sp. YR627]
MTIVQFEYIVAVDTYRSFNLAAKNCYVTQPTLSMQIQKLEDSLGVKIFNRSKSPVTPTEVGIEVIAQARVLLAEYQKIQDLVSDRNKELSGELRIGIIPTVAPYIVPKIITRFIEKYPAVKLLVWEQNTEQITQQLKLGLIDCGIVSTPLHDPQLKETTLFYENFVAYVSEESQLAKKKKLRPEDINVEELWILNDGHCMRDQVLNICQHRKTTRGSQHYEYNTGSIETLKRMVDENNGATILPELALDDLSEEQQQKLRYFQSPEPAREIGLITMKNFAKRRMIEALKTEVISLVPPRLKSKTKKELIEA